MKILGVTRVADNMQDVDERDISKTRDLDNVLQKW